MTDKPLDCIGIDTTKKLTGKHDFREGAAPECCQHFEERTIHIDAKNVLHNASARVEND